MTNTEHTTVMKGQPLGGIPGYKFVGLLGQGGMGEVFEAVQLSLDRTVAIKILNPQFARDEKLVARFEKEAAALAALRHPNVVSILDKGRTANSYYIVMEFIEGPSLREVIRRPTFETGAAIRMWLDVARGIDYAHKRGVIHRDLKPENILFDEPSGHVAKVTDFGLAAVARPDPQGRMNVTGLHVAMGTLAYMAPEQSVDAHSVDHRADIYSLGVVLFELLVGDVPRGDHKKPSEKKPDLDKRLDAVISKCLQASPDDRYQSVADLIVDVEPLAPTPLVTQLSERFLELAKTLKRRSVAFATLFVVSIVVAFVLGLRSSAKALVEFVPDLARFTEPLPAQRTIELPSTFDTKKGIISLGAGDRLQRVNVFGSRFSVASGELRVDTRGDEKRARAELDIGLPIASGFELSAQIEVRPEEQGVLHILKDWLRLNVSANPEASLYISKQERGAGVIYSRLKQSSFAAWMWQERNGFAALKEQESPLSVDVAIRYDLDSKTLTWPTATSGSDKEAVTFKDVSFGEQEYVPLISLGCAEAACTFSKIKIASIARVVESPAPKAQDSNLQKPAAKNVPVAPVKNATPSKNKVSKTKTKEKTRKR